MRARSLITVLLLGATSISVVNSAASQGSAGAKGFFLGAGLHGTVLDTDDPSYDSQSGAGVSVQGGYGFNPRFALFLQGSGAALQTDGESLLLTHADFGLRYHLPGSSKRFIPFVDGALTAWAFADEEAQLEGQRGELEFSGAGITIGAGLLYFLGREVAVSGQLKFTKGEFFTVRFENVTAQGLHPGATSARFNVGLTWFLGGGRTRGDA